MNRKNGQNTVAGASTAHYSTQSAYESRSSHSGFHSFLKWFKKDEHGRSIRNVSNSKSTKEHQHSSNHHFNSTSIDEIRNLPSSHPKNGLSASSSCDSIISTATTGFAFIPPNQYRPNGNAFQPEILIEAGPATDTYRQRLRAHQNAIENDKKLELTLRKKYNIFDSDTITSVDSIFNRLNGNKRPHYTDRSLPQPSTSSQIIKNSLLSDDDTIGRIRKPNRRTASDSSKDKKAGAYLHVKGKRKAPDPPPKDNGQDSGVVNDNRLSTSTNSGTLSPHSTLGRKKRKAPPPPPLKNTQQPDHFLNEDFPTVFNNGLMDDEEIKAIIQGRSSTGLSAMDKSKKPSSAPIPCAESASIRCTDTLKLEKGILRSTRDSTNSQIGKSKPDDKHASISPSSISPRPWYKRSPASNKDYAIPFKKEIVLRTMEKRKTKKSAKDLESPQLPEFGFSRNSSLFEGFFSRSSQQQHDHRRTDDQEKRRSGIGMPNISELDREAAEIVLKEQENQRAKRLEEHEKYFNKVNESKENIAGDDNGIKFTLNNAFIQKSDRQCVDDLNGNESRGSKIHLINRMEKPSSSSNDTTETRSIFSNSVNKLSTVKTVNDPNEKSSTTVKQCENNVPSVVVVNKKNDSTIKGKHVWICAYCTLENASARVICEVCERIRPPDKQIAGMPVIDSPRMLPSSNLLSAKEKVIDQQNPDWDNKADKVMKYFRPRLSYNSLSKSSSETSVVSKSTTKRPTSKVPLSPKMFESTRQKKIGSRISDTDIVRPPPPSTTKSSERLSPLIDSSAVVTTVTPVFYAPSQSAKIECNDDEMLKKQTNRNLEEVRLARLAKFSQSQSTEVKESEKLVGVEKIPIIDSSSLEREKQRLREMIRAMNARALAEKYPILQKSISLDGDSSPTVKAEVTDLSIGREVEPRLKPGTGVIKKLPNRKYYAEDKEIADNSNFASSSKMDKEKLFLKLSPEQPFNLNKPHRADVLLLIPTPIQEINEDEKSPTALKLVEQSRIYDGGPDLEPLVSVDNSNCAAGNRPDLVKISEELNSSKGLENFKATLRNSSKQFNNTNTLALNKILKNLEVAISEGKHELAASLAMDLAKMKVSLTVTKQQQQNQQRLSGELVEPLKVQNVVVDMFVQDKTIRKGPIHISIFPTISVLDLKRKILRDFRIPIERQQWILNDKLATDDKQCLTEFGMDDKSVIYLYIQDLKTANDDLSDEKKLSNVVSSSANTTDQMQDEEVGAKALPPLPAEEIPGNRTLKVGWVCPLCTLINSPSRPGCVACSETRPSNYVIPDEYKSEVEYEMPEELKRFLNDDCAQVEKLENVTTRLHPEKSNDLSKTKLVNRKSAEIFNISITEKETDDASTSKSAFSYKSENPIHQTTSIVMTAITSSPNITKNRYRGVDNYNPHVMKKVEIIPTTKFGVIPKPVTISKLQEPLSGRTSLLPISQPVLKKPNSPDDGAAAKTASKHYSELLSLDTTDVVPNSEPFECPICFMKYGVKEGVVLRDCLHVFCRECIINTVKYNDDAEVKCPYLDEVYSCDSVIQEREIKSLVSKDIFEQHLAISLRVAENRTENAYHCKTPNCRGWCIFEDNVNEFKCPICKIMNCLTCNVIHDGLNCKQYQDQMNSNCDSNSEARRTKDMLAEMIEKGDAMNCPICQVILMKKWGCDWLKCSMCKTEICWVTRGMRWGPEGKGDTSAGCKCGVNGVKCHPKCNYCH